MTDVVRAHGYLIRAIPEDRAVLERSPARVQYWFSEGLEPQYSTIVVRDQAGNEIATGGLSENDDKLLTVRLPNNLPDGAYTVDLRLAFASDGHVIVERRVFFVGEAVAGVGG
ncbi:MAG: copper resistance protein CopC [Chloroflexota bacterium]|nr:copper resistance protein CopC [Chloroflexota bacterium]